MLTWLMNPLMLGLGSLAIALPIIIHLLNKRRFKTVEWAAMDFLFEAEKKNRRRVRIENFLLLFLRCLAMLLIGLLLARPFLPSDAVQAVQRSRKFERIVLIDDSLSSQVTHQDMPSIHTARDSLVRLLSDFAESNSTRDWLTVITTSNPEQPLLANEPVTLETLPALLEKIEDIEASDRSADYVKSLSELRRYFSGQEKNVTRVAYVYSDLRQRDWLTAGAADSESTTADGVPNELLNQIAIDAAETWLIDVAGDNDQNLTITSLRPLDLQVADRVVRFAAEVANFGESTIESARVLFQVNDAPPQYQTIANLAPGKPQEVVFPYLFSSDAADPAFSANLNPADSEQTESGSSTVRNYRVAVEIDRQSMTQQDLQSDQLLADSSAFFAARIHDGIPVLLVDGDPSAVAERSETHYLNSLSVLGTGLRTELATVSELETASLSKYRVIFLCNVDEASADRIETLKNWVADGGNLVLMPGNRTRAATFNETFHEAGAGLSPLKLDSIAGDPTMSSWVNFEVDPQIHPAFRVVVDSDSTSLGRVDIFSWWTSSFDADQLGRQFSIPLRLTDDRNSPAMADRSWGMGRVILFAIPADGDWSMWPSSPTYAPVMLDLVDYLVGSIGENSNVRVGGTISLPVDLSLCESRVSLKDPLGERIEAVAGSGDESGDESKQDATDDVLCRVQFDDVGKRGFYEAGLTRHSGSKQQILFSSNIDPAEGQLQRLSASVLGSSFFSNKVKQTTADEISNKRVTAGNTEIWPQIVWLLLMVLASEQFLGWWFGRKR